MLTIRHRLFIAGLGVSCLAAGCGSQPFAVSDTTTSDDLLAVKVADYTGTDALSAKADAVTDETRTVSLPAELTRSTAYEVALALTPADIVVKLDNGAAGRTNPTAKGRAGEEGDAHTVTVGSSAVDAHLAHGDRIGDCDGADDEDGHRSDGAGGQPEGDNADSDDGDDNGGSDEDGDDSDDEADDDGEDDNGGDDDTEGPEGLDHDGVPDDLDLCPNTPNKRRRIPQVAPAHRRTPTGMG